MRKEGKVYKYKDLEVQAVDGTVRLINVNDKYEGTNKQEQRIALSDWRDRILSITRGCQYYAEREESLNTAEKESYKEKSIYSFYQSHLLSFRRHCCHLISSLISNYI